jgi:hypothetical protein
MQRESWIQLVGVLIEVVDPLRVEAAGATLEAMDAVALLEQQLRQITAVLAGDARNQRNFATHASF